LDPAFAKGGRRIKGLAFSGGAAQSIFFVQAKDLIGKTTTQNLVSSALDIHGRFFPFPNFLKKRTQAFLGGGEVDAKGIPAKSSSAYRRLQARDHHLDHALSSSSARQRTR
jgi:hypothetical protein